MGAPLDAVFRRQDHMPLAARYGESLEPAGADLALAIHSAGTLVRHMDNESPWNLFQEECEDLREDMDLLRRLILFDDVTGSEDPRHNCQRLEERLHLLPEEIREVAKRVLATARRHWERSPPSDEEPETEQ